MYRRLSLGLAVLALGLTAMAGDPVSLFDGKTFKGWEGDTQKTWRIEEGAITGGSLEKTVPRNEFLCSKKSYGDFELRLKYKLIGTEGFINGGVQIRSVRIPNHHEMIGYQADLGNGFDGALYDESRRNKILAGPKKEDLPKIVIKEDWNDYKIRCTGKRIQLWLNGTQTVDYTEMDEKIPLQGILGLQIHGNCKAVVRFKDIVIEELGAAK